MSNAVYITKRETTFSKVAQRVLGLSSQGPDVAAANPGITEPIPEGTSILVPTGEPILMGDILPGYISVGIGGRNLPKWDRLIITQNLTGVSTFSLAVVTGMSSQLKPFGYETIQVFGCGGLIFTGRCLTYDTDTSGSLLQVTGYSLPGVLGDCTAPISAWPLEFDGMNIAQIARKLAKPFGIKIICDAPGAAFPLTDCKTGDKVLKYLDSLAGMRNLSLRTDAEGSLIIEKIVTDAREGRINLTIGKPPLVKMSFSANGQALYSDIVGAEPMMYGLGGGRSRSKDPRVTVPRPLVYDIPATLDTKVETDATVRHARKYISAMGIKVSIATWKTPQGDPWSVGKLVQITGSVGRLKFKDALFVVSQVVLSISSDTGATADLKLALPEIYEGKVPQGDVWEY